MPSTLSTTTAKALAPEQLEVFIKKSQELLLSHQFNAGYWYYTLEANESIGAEYILLTEFLGATDFKRNQAIANRLLSQQRPDGSWALYYDGPGDLGTTIECYWALKLCDYPQDHPSLVQAREFIRLSGGPTKARIFTKIHLALFGLAPWKSAPAMPLALILAPNWAPINIYEFSSWARACIVPLLVLLNERPIHLLSMDLEELYPEPPEERSWKFDINNESYFSLGKALIFSDNLLKNINFFKKKVPLKDVDPLRKKALKACESYIRQHVEKTEDIFPALSYGAMALKVLGADLSDPHLKKALTALQNFQQPLAINKDLPALPHSVSSKDLTQEKIDYSIHQQCCISPVWDTAWASVALIESGFSPQHPALIKSSEWLLKKQVTEDYGDWAIKNKRGRPGGWSFEFDNLDYPDVDDTLEVLILLYYQGLEEEPQRLASFEKGFAWLMSMQSKNGGWAAFDVDNNMQWLNKLPFSDHGACLDPPTADITARVLEFLAFIHYERQDPALQKALKFLLEEQKSNGSWEGRWGVHYLYGTWCALQALGALGEKGEAVEQAITWLESVQNPDGGWGESCAGYREDTFVGLEKSVPSQTAWAVMGLLSVTDPHHPALKKGIQFLIESQKTDGSWEESAYTGTGFPGHFYIRYHGYRHYFPLMALGKYKKALESSSIR